MAKEKKLTIFPKYFVAIGENKIYNIPVTSKFAIKLASWDLIEKIDDQYLFLGEKGYVRAVHTDDGDKLRTVEIGTWEELLEKEPFKIIALPSSRYKDLDFIKRCFVAATQKYYDIIENSRNQKEVLMATYRKDQILDVFKGCIEQAVDELEQYERLLQQAIELEDNGDEAVEEFIQKFLDKMQLDQGEEMPDEDSLEDDDNQAE